MKYLPFILVASSCMAKEPIGELRPFNPLGKDLEFPTNITVCYGCVLQPIASIWINDTFITPNWISHDIHPAGFVRSNECTWALNNPGNISAVYDWAGNRLEQFGEELAGSVSIDAFNAWSVISDAPNTLVAMIDDSGIDAQHPDIAANIWSETPTNYLSSTGPHGTQIAGCIMAVGGNDIGVSGVVRHGKLFPIKPNSLSDSNVAMAIDEAITNGARVINMSFGYTQTNPPMAISNALVRARNADVVVCVAAINPVDGIHSQDATLDWPASFGFSNIVVVGGCTRDAQPYSYTGNTITVYAPARVIVTTIARRTVNVFTIATNFSFEMAYAYTGGTSDACGYTSGTVTLLRELYPTENYTQIISRLVNGAINTNGLRILNAYRAMQYNRRDLLVSSEGLAVSGSNGDSILVETSNNLLEWNTLTNLVGNGFPIKIANVTNSESRFYRAKYN